MNQYFQFKKFLIRQDRCAMKVGTDGVLLGAWAKIPATGILLDIGTGSGLIALMAAQRGSRAVVGIDMDEESVSQARENVSESEWKNHIEIQCCMLQNFITEQTFDAIVSNPPFFTESLLCPDQRRSATRHTQTLSFQELVKGVDRLLSAGGEFSVVLPFAASDRFIQTCWEGGLHLLRRTDVFTRPGMPARRTLMSFVRTHCHTKEFHNLVIEDESHNFTEEYKALTKDFYLNF
jgi:tRNA1Val (adenine37-N6)-methyltransferase